MDDGIHGFGRFARIAGKGGAGRNFAQELEPHRAEWDRLCREAGGFTHYNMTLQESPMGDLCIYSMVLDDPAKIRMRFGDTPYDRWWLAFAKDVHGIDLNGPDVPAPPPSVFTWKAPTA